MRTRRLIIILSVVLAVAGACGGDEADDNAGGTSTTTATTGAATDGTATTAAGPDGELVCTVADDGVTFDLGFTNGAAEPMTWIGPVTILEGSNEVATTDIRIDAVAPGEVVRETFYTSAGGGADGCRADAVIAEPQPADFGADDVSVCQGLRAGENGQFSYDIVFTNPSQHVPAKYSTRVAIHDPDGVRRLTRLVTADYDNGAYNDVAPGATVTETDETLLLDYEDGWTCEVVSVTKYTDEFFEFDSATGETRGSLNSDIGFATGSAELTADAEVLLQSAVKRLLTSSGPVCVEGFADSVGADADNLTLSQERADAVADYLRTAGVT
ncbi:MAG: OmpA family protein, partial [Acidimicrobiales bacterium]